MKNQTRDNLIEVIRKSIPEDANLTIYLSDQLNISRESAYRRIRGEINFTFEELVSLSQDLGFSLDNIVGAKRDENALFNIHMLQKIDYMDIYVNKMLEYGRLFGDAANLDPNARARLSINTLPYLFHIRHETLSKLRIYKWLYQNQKIGPSVKFSDFVLPEKVKNAHITFAQDILKVPNITMILDNNVFWSVSKEIEYFYKRGLLSDQELENLKTELHTIINSLEEMSTCGVCRNNVKVDIYISAVDLEATYLHFEYDDKQFSQVRIYSISAIDSYDKGLCEIQKKWIESLKRFSTLISESGEMQRFEYMKKQRELINNISRFDRYVLSEG